MFRRLLVAIDSSPHADLALRAAVDVAQAGNGRITMLTVAPRPTVWAAQGVWDVPVDLSTLNQEFDRAHRDLLDAAVDRVPDNIPVTKLLKHGAAGPAILDVAMADGHDLIVMGSRGRGELRSL